MALQPAWSAIIVSSNELTVPCGVGHRLVYPLSIKKGGGASGRILHSCLVGGWPFARAGDGTRIEHDPGDWAAICSFYLSGFDVGSVFGGAQGTAV